MRAVELRFPRSFYIRHGLIGGMLGFFCVVIVLTQRHGGWPVKMVPALFLGPWFGLVWREYRLAVRMVDEDGVRRHDGRTFFWKDLKRVDEVRMFIAGSPTGPVNHLDLIFADGRARILVLTLENAAEAWEFVRRKQKGGESPAPAPPAPVAMMAPADSARSAASPGRCGTCGELGDYHYALQKHGREDEDTFLPAAAGRLRSVCEIDPDKRPNQTVEQCPDCGAWFLYKSSYEYLATGSEDEQTLSRLSAEQARALIDSAKDRR